jgi:hypothetical protein
MTAFVDGVIAADVLGRRTTPKADTTTIANAEKDQVRDVRVIISTPS